MLCRLSFVTKQHDSFEATDIPLLYAVFVWARNRNAD